MLWHGGLDGGILIIRRSVCVVGGEIVVVVGDRADVYIYVEYAQVHVYSCA